MLEEGGSIGGYGSGVVGTNAEGGFSRTEV